MKIKIILIIITFAPLLIFGQTETDSLRAPCEFPSYVNEKEIYTFVENSASFPGGVKEFKKFIKKNFIMPKVPSNQLENVYIRFIVDEFGNCIHPCVMTKANKYLNPEIEKATIDLFNKFPKFIPGCTQIKR